MNMHVSLPTPTEFAAIERRRAFRDKIAAQAAALGAPKPAPLPAAVIGAGTAPAFQPLRVGLPDWFWMETKAPIVGCPTILQIQKAVSDYFAVTRNDLCCARRHKDIVYPRHVAIYLCRDLTLLSLPVIGRHFGGRDHTTCLNSIWKITRLVREDCRVALDVVTLTDIINGAP